MINLIPNEEKKKMARNFYHRLTALSFLLLGFFTAITFVVVLPSYFLSLVKENFANSKLETQKREPAPTLDPNMIIEIRNLDSKLALIEKVQKKKFIVSERVINQIISDKMPDIRLTRISYENIIPTGKKININGIAPSRERLLLFREMLEGDSTFKNVNLPISNFIKGANIQFSLTLSPS